MLLESLSQSVLPWQKPKLSKNSAVLQFRDTVATLSYKPFTLEVKRGREVLVTLNSRNMFAFEQTRSKQVSSFVQRPFSPSDPTLSLGKGGAFYCASGLLKVVHIVIA